MPSAERQEKKAEYFNKLIGLLEQYPQILIVHADHVGSKQMANIRINLRGKAVLLMGKNTMMRTALRKNLSKFPEAERLLPCIKENIGFVFCIDSMEEVRKEIINNKVPAPARQGVVAPLDVNVPPGPTGMDPSQTSFFQALGISTKIVKGQIEIQSEVHLIKKGERVTASQSVLLQKLNVRPFTYGLEIKQVYDDGSVYDGSVLELTDEEILNKVSTGITNVAAISRQLGMPTAASVSHAIVEAFKNATALVLNSDYTFPQMEQLKKMIENPDAFVSAAPAAAAAAAPAAAKEAVKEEEPESDDDMGLDLFG